MKKILVLIAMLLVSLATVSAYSVSWTINGNMPFGMRSYKCPGNVCTEGTVQFLQHELDNSQVTLNFNDNGNPDTYAFFLHPQDACHVPTSFSLDFGSSGTFASDFNFYQESQAKCGAVVKHPTVEIDGVPTVCTEIDENTLDCGEVSVLWNSTITFNADVGAGWSSQIDFVPDDMHNYFDSTVDIFFEVDSVLKDSEQTIIHMDDVWYPVSYQYTPPGIGEYELKIYTSMDDDCKCDGSTVKYKKIKINVTEYEIPEFSTIGLISLLALLGIFIFKRKR